MINSTKLIDTLLNGIGEKLQLNKSRRDKVEVSYRAVANWLSSDLDLFNGTDTDIYPQGSYKIETTVKPIKDNEYDLDFVLEIKEPWAKELDAMAILDKVEKRMKENDIYRDKVERKNRCIRINYADEFHMDILPGYPCNYVGNTDMKVPDCNTENWKDSAPKGYAEWFEDRCRISVLLEKAAKIEPLPQDTPFQIKPPLKRAIQLIKRQRDIYFYDDDKNAPISIVLTTLAGAVYHGEDSAFTALRNILMSIKSMIEYSSTPIEVLNPSNSKEKLSERWDEDPKLYEHFRKFIFDFNNAFVELEASLNQGIDKVSQKLEELFGEDISREVLKEHAEFISKHRLDSNLNVNTKTGAIGIGSASLLNESAQSIPRNTFHGD
jgi:hypothetical protein